jgi:hypothetical protein
MSVVAVAVSAANSGRSLPVLVAAATVARWWWFQRAKRNFIFFEMSGLKILRKEEANRANNRQ